MPKPQDPKDKELVNREDRATRRQRSDYGRAVDAARTAKDRLDSTIKDRSKMTLADRLKRREAERSFRQATDDVRGVAQRLIAEGKATREEVLAAFQRLERKHGRLDRSIRGWVTRDQLLGNSKSVYPGQFGPTPGELVAKSAEYAELLKSNRFPTPHIFVGSFFGGTKATPLATNAIADFVEPVRLPPIAPTLPVLRIRSLLPRTTMSSPVIQYLREVAFIAATRGSVTTITSVGTVATATTGAAHGLLVGDHVSIRGAAETKYNGDDIEVLTVPTTTTFTYAVASAGATSATGTLTWVKGRTHGAAAGVAEGSLKPMAEWVPTLETANAETVAHGMTVTEQAIKDVAQLQTLINNRLLYGLSFREDVDLLYGSGVTPNIKGLLTDPMIQTYTWSTGEPLDKKGDAFRRAMTQVLLAEYEPTGGILHPKDYEEIELSKSEDGMYLFIPMQQVTDLGLRLFRVPVVQTAAIRRDTGIVANFAQATELFDREEANVRVFDQHEDLAAKNMLYIRAEERLALVVYRPQAIVKINFDAPPAP